jgi:adenosine kinase
MSKIIVSGSLAYDRIMDYPGLFAEHVVPEKANSINLSFMVDKLSVEFGGTAGNIAYNLALLGEHPEIVASAGQDFAAYKSHLLLAGVDPETIRFLEGVMTSSAFVFTDKDDNQIAAFYPGAGGAAYDAAVNTEDRALAIISPGCLDDMIALSRQYKRTGFKYLFDPGQQTTSLSADNLRECISGAQVVFGNDYEIGLITQKTGWTEETMLEHTPTLVVTHGSRGSRVRTRTTDVQVGVAQPEAVVDPTGAGDSYRAGFIKGLVAGFTLEACARLGSAVASYVVERHGTQNHSFTMDELKARYKKAFGEDLKL